MRTPRINWILIIVFALASALLFSAALVSPPVRSITYAPLRDIILPAPKPILLEVLYSTEKEAWLEEVLVQWQRDRLKVGGRPIELQMEKMGSREMYLEVLNGTFEPDLISPASSLQISILEDLSKAKFGSPLVVMKDLENCRPVVTTPLVLVAWADRADALWGDNPNGNLWLRLHAALVSKDGWAAYGHPEWGYIKFGHTDPTSSNSGFMTLLLMSYNYYSKSGGLNESDILSNPEFQAWMQTFEASVPEFGSSTGTYMRDIVAYGPSRYDMVAVYEATAIEQLENAIGRYGELRVYYPPATVLSDHPFCVIQADWVTPEKAEAARLFIDYLTRRDAQEIAMLNHGFRPVDAGIPLDQAGSPFVQYAANGVQLSYPPEVEIPPGNVLDTLLTFWIRNIQR
jgi:ABC-type Fe3+ transport system substrate-binding protein